MMSPQSRAMVACLLTQCFTLPETDEAAKAIQSLRRIADLQLGRMRKLTRPSVARVDRLATIANTLRERAHEERSDNATRCPVVVAIVRELLTDVAAAVPTDRAVRDLARVVGYVPTADDDALAMRIIAEVCS